MSTQDTRFFDTFTLVIGLLIAIAVALAIFALFFGVQTQRDVRKDDTSYQLALAERIAPFGKGTGKLWPPVTSRGSFTTSRPILRKE